MLGWFTNEEVERWEQQSGVCGGWVFRGFRGRGEVRRRRAAIPSGREDPDSQKKQRSGDGGVGPAVGATSVLAAHDHFHHPLGIEVTLRGSPNVLRRNVVDPVRIADEMI